MAHRRRTVVTGWGMVAPADSPEELWEAVREGISLARPIQSFDATGLRTKYACFVNGNFNAELSSKQQRRYTWGTQLGLIAARRALACARIDETSQHRLGLIEASSISDGTYAVGEEFSKSGVRGVKPSNFGTAYIGCNGAELCAELGIRNRSYTLSTGSASGCDLLGHGMEMIRRDQVDIALVGAAERTVFPAVVASFSKNRVLAVREDAPAEATRPFHRDRNGFLLGEGGFFLVLEELTHALWRGAPILAELSGYGFASEGLSPISPDESGKGIQEAAALALADAGLGPSAIDFIYPHGTGTPKGDAAEILGLSKVFREGQAIASTKAVTGHPLAAAGVMESIIALWMIRDQIVFPSAFLDCLDPAFEGTFDFVRRVRQQTLTHLIKMSVGFGGKVSAVVISKYERYRPNR